jgi:PAS domain S-box-containing protein
MAAAGAAAGSGVWVTHFAATIGFQHIRSAGAYDPVLTLASLAIAVGGFWLMFALAGRSGPLGRAFAGAGLGLVIGGLHYVGVRALAVFGFMQFELEGVVVSVVLGAAGGAAALSVVGEGRRLGRTYLAAVLLALGVAGLHFTGMAALQVAPGGEGHLGGVVGPRLLSALMAVVVGAVVTSICAAALFASRTRDQSLGSLRTALDALPAGIAVFDPQDRIVTWNERYAQAGGAAREVLAPGRSFRELLVAEVALGRHPDAIGREEAWLDARLAARRAERDEEHCFDGVWARIQDRRTADGGMVSIITDVTALKAAAAELAEARDRAEAANAAKSEFLANMSHELRTPLNGVVGLASVLAASALPNPLKEMAQVIVASSISLERLLSDVLDLAKVEAGRLTISPEPCDPRALLDRVAPLHAASARAKGLEFSWRVDTAAPREVLCDPLRVEQVLNNLLSNAVKFTTAGAVEVRVRAASGELVVEVEDTGIGFAQADAERLFERFAQADGSATRRFGGTGLGLAISRELAVLMGGSLSAVSRPGQGSCFTLSLPLDGSGAGWAQAA